MRSAIQRMIQHTLEEAESERTKLDENSRFAHYTSVESALKIIDGPKGPSLWLRNVQLMNDFSEIEFGANVWMHTFSNSERGIELLNNVEAHYPDVRKWVFDDIQTRVDQILVDTFITSLSVHPKRSDERHPLNEFGKLSMWRAYAPKNGCALILKVAPFLAGSQTSRLVSVPIVYCRPTDELPGIQNVIDEFKRISDPHGPSKAYMFEHFFKVWFVLSTISLKHKCFEEEAEWRVFYSNPICDLAWPELPRDHPGVVLETHSVRGVPQRLMTAYLNDVAAGPLGDGNGIPDLRADTFFDEVLIGPSEYPGPLADVIGSAFERLKFPQAWERVTHTHVPLRVSD